MKKWYMICAVVALAVAANAQNTETLSGVFSIDDAGTKVRFSRGNLQYVQSTNTWQFAEHQYDMLGEANAAGDALADKIDLFGWSMQGASVKWGVSASTDDADYQGDVYAFADWGRNIGDGKTWRTLTVDEWWYILERRNEKGSLAGTARLQIDAKTYVNGLVLLPDNWVAPKGVTFKTGYATENSKQDYAHHQVISLREWTKLEAAGAVFLPACGERFGSVVSLVQEMGYYWTADFSEGHPGYALMFYFQSRTRRSHDRDYSRGNAVRLVSVVQ